MVRILTSLLLCVISLTTFAETTLDTSVDRTKIYESDTINLRITGNVDMDFSFGGLMNFGRNQVDAPDLPGLEEDFEILDRQQNYNMQSINGETKAQITWSYSLAPKRTGTLIIPTAKYKDAESKAIQITVLGGRPPQDANNPPTVFMETEVDKSSVYVQEQILYTVRLYTAGRLASGNWYEAESTDAIIESFGEQKKYYRMAYNRRYEVIERQYLIFPQKSGDLSIEAHRFDGMLIDSANRRRLRIREQSDPLELSIKPPPASFSGQTWLPATSLHLNEKWDGDPASMLVGDSITRTLDISTLGLLGSALPPINLPNQQGIKIYPDKAETDSVKHTSGVQSIRKQSTAIVAVSDGTIDLPEINIPWWDTVNDVERVANIPAQQLIITPNPATQALIKQKATPPELGSFGDTQYAPSGATPEPHAGNTINIENVPSAPHNQAWYTLIFLLIAGWTCTTWFLLKRLREQATQNNMSSTAPEQQSISEKLKQLNLSIKNNDDDMPKRLIQWAQSFTESKGLEIKVQSIKDLNLVSAELYQQAQAFEQMRYAASPDNSYDRKRLSETVKELSKSSQRPKSKPALKPMYP